MTLKELTRASYLEKLIERQKEKLEETDKLLQDDATGDKELEKIAEDQKRALEKSILRSQKEKARVDRYLASIRDPMLYLIFDMRFFKRMTWRDIAQKIGGGNSEDTVKAAVYRKIRNDQNTRKEK